MENSLNKSIVEEKFAIIHKQISDHPNFDLQKIQREVVIEEVRINAKKGVIDRGFHLSYHILHYNKGEVDNSFVKTANIWEITDELLITERNLDTFEPIINPEYLKAVEANKIPSTIVNPDYVEDNPEFLKNPNYIQYNPETIPNPDYVSDEELLLIPETIPNPDYVSDEETPDIPKFITNPDYITANNKNKYNPKTIPNQYYVRDNPETIPNPNYITNNPKIIPNPNYVSKEQLDSISEYSLKPAFSYILSVVKNRPYLLFILIEFYLEEQDRDGFFNNYNNV